MGEVATRYSSDRVEPEASQNRTVPSSWLKPSSAGWISHQTGSCSQKSLLSVILLTWMNGWVGGCNIMCVTGLCVCVHVCFVCGGEGGLGGEGRKGLSQTCTNNLLHKTTPYVKSSSICIIPKYQITKTNFKRKRLIFRRNIRFHIRHNILTYRPHTITTNKHVSAPSPCKHALPCNQQVFGGWLFGKVLPTSNRPLLLHNKGHSSITVTAQSQLPLNTESLLPMNNIEICLTTA